LLYIVTVPVKVFPAITLAGADMLVQLALFTGAPTVTVTDCNAEVPPGPVHWKVKVVLEVRGFVRPLPESVPELDQGPPAVQLVAPVEPQVRVGRPLYAIDVGEIERVAVAGAVAQVWLV
jgi:hypothetical protein